MTLVCTMVTGSMVFFRVDGRWEELFGLWDSLFAGFGRSYIIGGVV